MSKNHYSYRQLKQQHEHTSSLKEKTRLELAMWDQLSPAQRKTFGIEAKFVKETFGTSEFDASNRSCLFNAGQDADPLWECVENRTMKVSTAIRLLRSTRKKAIRANSSMSKEVLASLAEYDRLPVLSGGVRRKKAPSHTRIDPGPQRSTKTKHHKELREIIADYVRAELPDGDLADLSRLISQLETDIKIAVDTFQTRLRNTRIRIEQHTTSMTRRQLKEAHETLLLEPPRHGKPIDIEAVRKNKRRLAREYHPDMNNGDEGMVAAYQAVMGAAELIEAEYARPESEI